MSYRNRNIQPSTHHTVHGIEVYTIDRLAQLKASAYQGRDKLRDLYDVCFICTKYFSELSEPTKNQLRDAFSYKGFDHYDYIVETQSDPLIDAEKLAEAYLKTFDKLGLLYTQDEQEQIQKTENSQKTTR